jgi:zeaxanthin glucosyltransferase
MATIGVLVPDSPGHLNPIGALGRELVRRGHRVVVATIPEVEPAVRAADLELAPIGMSDYPDGYVSRVQETLGRLRGWAAFKFTIDVVTRNAQMVLRDAPQAMRAAGAELILVDQASPGGGAVADHLGLPFVSIASALVFNRETAVPPIITTWGLARSPLGRLRNYAFFKAVEQVLRPYRRVVDGQRRAWGLPLHNHPNETFSPLAQISQQPPEFEFPRRELPPHFHFAGPFLDPQARVPVPFPFEALDGRPLVYASMGTLQNGLLWIFRAMAEACAGLGVQLVISLGGPAEPEVLGKLPGSPLVVRFAPQLELLSRARLTITHAGLNTALESLARGVPMAAIPITNDQPGVAARIAWTGTGLVIPPSRLTARRLRAAVIRLLEDPSFARNADRLREAIGRCGGSRRAADVVERVLTTGRPVLAETFEGPVGSAVFAGGVGGDGDLVQKQA